MEKIKEVNYHIEAMEKLPKKWDYNHTLLEIKKKSTEGKKMETLFKMSYFPYFNSIFITTAGIFLNTSNSQIIGFPYFRGIFKGEEKEASLSSIMKSNFFLTYPKDLVEEFTEKYYDLYDLLVKNEYELGKIPMKDDYDKFDKAEYYALNDILSGRYSPLEKFFKENEVKGLFINLFESNLLPSLEYKIYSDGGLYNKVKLHKDNDNHFHVVIYFRGYQFSIPLEYSNKMIRETLTDRIDGLYDTYEDMIVMYYKCLQFKEYIEYYNLCEDLSIYDFPKVTFLQERDNFTLCIGEFFYIGIRPIVYNLEFFYKVNIRTNTEKDFFNSKLIDFFMDQNSLILLISYLLNREVCQESSLPRNVSKLVQYARRNTSGDEFGEWNFKDGVESWKKLLKNYIEIKYNKDAKKYIYRRYLDSEVVDIELNNFTFLDLLVNVANPDEVESAYKMNTYRKITHNEDLKDYPEDLKNMKRYIEAMKDLKIEGPEGPEGSEPETDMEMEMDKCFREGREVK